MNTNSDAITKMTTTILDLVFLVLKIVLFTPAFIFSRILPRQMLAGYLRKSWCILLLVIAFPFLCEWIAKSFYESDLTKGWAVSIWQNFSRPALLAKYHALAKAHKKDWLLYEFGGIYAILQIWIFPLGFFIAGRSIEEKVYGGKKKTQFDREKLSFWTRLRRGKRLEHKRGYLALGWLSHRAKVVFLGKTARTMHMQVVGATGSGKTEALKRMIEADIKNGLPVIWIDGKGDISNAEWFLQTAFMNQRLSETDLLLPAQKFGSYNPLKHGDATEIKDRLTSAIVWSDEYYKGRCEVIVQAALRALKSRPLAFTMDDLLIAINPAYEGFKYLIAQCQDFEAREELAEYARSKEWQQDTAKIRDGLRVLISSSFRQLFEAQPNQIDFWQTYQQNRLAYMSVPVNSSPDFMRFLGKLIIADLNGLNSAIATGIVPKNKWLCSVVIDEFGSFVTPQFLTFLKEARSQNFAITIAHQSLGDLKKLDEYTADQIQGNTNVKLILRQDAWSDSDNWAKLIGTITHLEPTYQTKKSELIGDDQLTGLGSLREVERFIVEPNQIKYMPQGGAVFLQKEPSPFVSLIDIAQATCQYQQPPDGKESIVQAVIKARSANDDQDKQQKSWNLRSIQKQDLVQKPKEEKSLLAPQKQLVQPLQNAVPNNIALPKQSAAGFAQVGNQQQPQSKNIDNDNQNKKATPDTKDITNGNDW